MISTLIISVDDTGTITDFYGDAYDLLQGIATAADLLINQYPKNLQQKARVEFIQMLNDAKAGKLYKTED